VVNTATTVTATDELGRTGTSAGLTVYDSSTSTW